MSNMTGTKGIRGRGYANGYGFVSGDVWGRGYADVYGSGDVVLWGDGKCQY